MYKNYFLSASIFLCLLLAGFDTAYAQQGNCNSINFNLAATFQTGQNAYSIAKGDLNKDGITDLVTANYDAKTVSVLFGDGYGGFLPSRDYPTEINISSVAVGDFNNDGKSDLIVGEATGGKLAILLNNGQGQFSAPSVITFPTNNVYGFYGLISADFNGDGNFDVAGLTQDNFSLFLGNGQGGLTQSTVITSRGYKNRLAVGDFNGDNITDLVITKSQFGDPFQVAVFFGSQSGTLSVNTTLSLPNSPDGVVVGDFNSDGKTDIALATNYPYANSTPQTHYLQPWFGDGAGNFNAGAKVNLPFLIEGLASGDFDGDGKLDLATGTGSLVITVSGVGDGTFQNLSYWTSPSSQLISADVNLDEKQDLITLQPGYPKSLVSVLISAGDEGFLLPKAIPYGDNKIAAADFNNDGLLDMVTASESSYVHQIVIALNDGKRGWLPDRVFETPVALKAMAVGDFNGDGNTDVVTAHTYNTKQIVIYLGDGKGNLGEPITRSYDTGIENVTAGDFNGDGKDDLFVIDSMPRGFVLLSNGDGTFSTTPEFSTEPIRYNVTPLTGDFNKDGKLDLVVTGDSGITIWIGGGDGTFTRGGNQPNTASYGANMVVGDVNSDDKLDVVTQTSGADTTIIRLFGDGKGGFESSSAQTITGQSSQMIIGDFNSDGIDDLALVNQNNRGNLVVIPSTAKAPFWEMPVYFLVGGLGNPSGGFSSALIAADYDGDDKIDIGFTNSGRSRGAIHNTGGQYPCISINDVTVTEGDSGTKTAVFTVSLSSPSSEVVRVNYTVEGQSATVGTDLQNVSGRLEIPAGQTSANINVPINGDIIDEFDETFKINLSSPSNADLGKSVGIGTITDDDDEPNLTVTDVAQNEPNSYQGFVFRVNISAPSEKPISFRCATADGTATADKDYIALNNTVSIQIGATFAECYVSVIPDNIYELDENFFLNVSDAVNVNTADPQGEGKIINDDPIPTLSIFNNYILEGDAGTTEAPVSIQLSNPSYLPITFHILTSAGGTATAGKDYVATDTTITIPSEQDRATATVHIIGDTINEPDETFFVNLYNVSNAALGTTQAQILIVDDETVANDYDRDGKTDFVVFRPNGGIWYTLFSSTNSFTGRQYGESTDIPVSGDYNGDARTDIAVWRPSNGTWYTPVPNRSQQWGADGDIPVQGDYDNDGKTDVAVFRPSKGFWYIQQSANNSFKFVQFGAEDDIPVQADYDGDGKTDIAVFRPSNNTWYIIRSSDNGFFSTQFGVATDKTVPADYDGDGKADIAVFRDGLWYFLKSSEGNKFSYFQWGQAGDKPVPGNYDGDDRTDFAVYRNGNWYIYRSSDGSFLTKQFGASDDIPIPFVSNN